MNKLEFTKDSWHYWFVNKTTKYIRHNEDYGTLDICGYTRAFIGGILKVLLLGTLIGFLTFCFGCAITLGLAKLFHWVLPKWVIGFGGVGTVLAIVAGSVVGLILSVGLLTTLKDRLDERRQGKPSAMKQMYRSWKQKTCTQIEFK